MRAEHVDDLPLFTRAGRFASEVFDLAGRLRQHKWLADELYRASHSIVSNTAEGFQQGTDRAFARYLKIAAGSCEEIRCHLAAGERLGCLPADQRIRVAAEAREITNMLRGFIRYLHRSNRTDRLSTR